MCRAGPSFLPAESTLLAPFQHPLRDDLVSKLLLISTSYLFHLFRPQIITEHLLSWGKRDFLGTFRSWHDGQLPAVWYSCHPFRETESLLLIPLHLSVAHVFICMSAEPPAEGKGGGGGSGCVSEKGH